MNKYNIFLKRYQVVLPINTEILIPQDDSVRIVKSVLERLDFADEVKAYAIRQRKVPFIVMLRIVVYGYMRGFRSVKTIETACRENINYMWLLEGYPAPDHNTIARFIQAIDISDRNDVNTLVPFLDKLNAEYNKRHKKMTLDSGYESEENYAYLKNNEQTAYIKPQNYEQSKTREYKSQIGRKENMKYNAEEDCYVCANGKKLNAAYNQHVKAAAATNKPSRFTDARIVRIAVKEICVQKLKKIRVRKLNAQESLKNTAPSH